MTSKRWWWGLFKRGKILHGDEPGYLERYDAAAIAATQRIIARYSSSFYLASRLLGGKIRQDIRSLYAVVRIADEIVDGTAHAAGLTAAEVAERLDAYERAVIDAPQLRFHTDPVLHAYAISARRCGFHAEHMRAFFASMRRDLKQETYEVADFQTYVYGSAEVIGLMCLDSFLSGSKVASRRREILEDGARRLGAAFQKINFLRDLCEDRQILGRNYLPQLSGDGLDEPAKLRLIADIRADLAAARAATKYLPLSARIGVNAATGLFDEVTDRLERLSAAEILRRRVRVPGPQKVALLIPAFLESLRPSALCLTIHRLRK